MNETQLYDSGGWKTKISQSDSDQKATLWVWKLESINHMKKESALHKNRKIP